MTLVLALDAADIGANLLDPTYSGEYNGKQYYKGDLQATLRRSYAAGVERIIITAGSFTEAKAALQLGRTDGMRPYILFFGVLTVRYCIHWLC